MYNFKRFQETNIKAENRITVTKSNSIGCPFSFYNNNNIKNYKYAVLFWDEDEKVIGIHFTNDAEQKGKFKIAHSKLGGGSIIARSFFKVNNISTDKYHGRYQWQKYNLEGVGELFVIKLEERDN